MTHSHPTTKVVGFPVRFVNNYGDISENFYEIDPYDKKSNPEGFNIED